MRPRFHIGEIECTRRMRMQTHITLHVQANLYSAVWKILTSRASGERLVALPAARKPDQAGMRRAPCRGGPCAAACGTSRNPI
jgi:hypothetical protein